jgi:hypothetical protein
VVAGQARFHKPMRITSRLLCLFFSKLFSLLCTGVRITGHHDSYHTYLTMPVPGQSRRFCHVGGMSGFGVISEMPEPE